LILEPPAEQLGATERSVARSPVAMADVASDGLLHALEAERAIEPRTNTRAAWEGLIKDARNCTRCHLYRYATQTVFGEGPLDAKIMFVGEQPGDQEDLAGRPFVGPAGALFDAALEKAGIERSTVYVTNAVKHFKFVLRGKRRIHNKPDAGEISACRWWIEHERELIRPPLTVALGATAARSLVGKVVTISKVRGEPLRLADGGECWVTVHPSAILRAPDEAARREGKRLFLRDLKRIKARAAELAP
jgi:DNA polymerase